MKKYNVLLAGNLDLSIWRMAKRLRNSSCNVTIAGHEHLSGTTKDGIRYFEDSGLEQLSILYDSGHFDTVVFFFSTKSESGNHLNKEGGLLGSCSDELRRHLNVLKNHPETVRFFLVTDQRVFASESSKTEDDSPNPDTGTGRIIRLAEQEVLSTGYSYSLMKTMIIRLTHLYCPGFISDFASGFTVDDESSGNTVILTGAPEKECNFISADDLTDFIVLAMEIGTVGTVHLSGAQTMTNTQLGQWFEGFGYNVMYDGETSCGPLLSGCLAADSFNWYPRNYLADDISKDITAEKKKTSPLEKLKAFRKKHEKWISWIETLIGAVLLFPLSDFLERNVVFGFIDIRLLYAVLMGCVHGTAAGWTAGLLAYVSYCLSYLETDTLWNLLLNMDNWIPFVFYLLAGGITGYVKSNHELEKSSMSEQIRRREDDLVYLQEVHKNTCDVRDMLMEQVVKSRDSYGKIYNMVEKLNSMYPDEIMFRALGLYEDILSNETVSIYLKDANSHFIRKLVESNGLKDKMNSINLESLPLISGHVSDGTLFSNTGFEAGYPSYCMPLRLSSGKDLLIIVWNAKENQWNKHYQNLIIVISKLALLSMDKAIVFQESPERYVKGTVFLKQEGFLNTWRIRRQMKLEKINDYVLFRFAASLPDDVLSERLGHVVRSVDVAGRMNNGTRYILMTQANSNDSDIILKRLTGSGVGAVQVEDRELESYCNAQEEGL